MSKTVWHIELIDGRIFRIFCDNSKQEKKLILQVKNLDEKVKSFIPITNGIHTAKQFNEILKTL